MSENPSWLFVAATLIAVSFISAFFKQLVASIEDRLMREEMVDPGTFQKALSRFFIKVAVVEVIPILLIVFGFISMEDWDKSRDQTALTMALMVVIFALFLGGLVIFLSRSRLFSTSSLTEATRNYLNSIVFIGISMVSAIPLISIVAIYLMMG